MEAMIFIWKSLNNDTKITHFNLDCEAFASDFRALLNSVVNVPIIDQVNVLALLVLAQTVDFCLWDTHLRMANLAVNVLFLHFGDYDIDDVVLLC